MIQLWTDGACSNNGQTNAVGGWGYILIHNNKIIKTDYGGEKNTTNQRMEMLAIIKGLEYIEENFNINFLEIRVYTDSAYCFNCWNNNWWQAWLDNNWVSSKKTPVKNKELWLKLIKWFEKPKHQFYMEKVKGHSGNELNELVDELARNGVKSV